MAGLTFSALGGRMFTTTKLKWLGTMILAGILLVLTFMGGEWGTNYSASAQVNASPIIQSIDPAIIPIKAPDTLMIIRGFNFGTLANTRVWLTETGNRHELSPSAVIPREIRVTIPRDMLAVPTQYQVQVAIYTNGTVPGDQLSNPVFFLVYSPVTYYPLILKDALLSNLSTVNELP
jgi:hypothetical protein